MKVNSREGPRARPGARPPVRTHSVHHPQRSFPEPAGVPRIERVRSNATHVLGALCDGLGFVAIDEVPAADAFGHQANS